MMKGCRFGALVLVAAGAIALRCGAETRAEEHFQGQHGGMRGSPSYLGIDLKDVTDDEVATLKLKDTRGAEITRVDHDGPAGKMGLREHDVVVQMNGVVIEHEEQIRRMLWNTPPGRTVVLVICRDGQQMTKTAEMADRSQVERQAWEQHLGAAGPQAPVMALPGDEAAAAGSSAPSGPVPTTRYSKTFLGLALSTPTYTGVRLERIGPQLSSFFGVPTGTGLLVRNVETNSPAAMAGIRAGDVVVRADTKTVGSMGDWAKAIHEAKGRPVTVVLLRDRQEKTVVLTADSKKRSGLDWPGLELPGADEGGERVAGLGKSGLAKSGLAKY